MCVGKVGAGGAAASLAGAADVAPGGVADAGGAAEGAGGTTAVAPDGVSAPTLRAECASAASANAEASASQPAPRMPVLDGVPPFEHDQDHDQREQHHGRKHGGRQPGQVVILEPPCAHEVATGDLSLGAAEAPRGDEVLDARHVRLLDVDHPRRITEDGEPLL